MDCKILNFFVSLDNWCLPFIKLPLKLLIIKLKLFDKIILQIFTLRSIINMLSWNFINFPLELQISLLKFFWMLVLLIIDFNILIKIFLALMRSRIRWFIDYLSINFLLSLTGWLTSLSNFFLKFILDFLPCLLNFIFIFKRRSWPFSFYLFIKVRRTASVISVIWWMTSSKPLGYLVLSILWIFNCFLFVLTLVCQHTKKVIVWIIYNIIKT